MLQAWKMGLISWWWTCSGRVLKTSLLQRGKYFHWSLSWRSDIRWWRESSSCIPEASCTEISSLTICWLGREEKNIWSILLTWVWAKNTWPKKVMICSLRNAHSLSRRKIIDRHSSIRVHCHPQRNLAREKRWYWVHRLCSDVFPARDSALAEHES